MLKKVFVSLFAAALIIPQAAQASSEIRFQSVYPAPHIVNVKSIVPWVEMLNSKSNGQFDLKYFAADAIIKMSDAYKSTKMGTLDMSGYSGSFSPAEFVYTTTIGQVFLAEDAVHGTKLAWEMYKQFPEVKAELEKDMQFLTMWTSDRSGLFSINSPILSPADLKGKRVLFWSGASGEQIKQWGGIPVQIPTADTYVALQRGMGEVFYGPLPSGTSVKLMEIAKHVTPLPVTVGVLMIGMNKDVFAELPEEAQQLFLESSGEALGMEIANVLKKSSDDDIILMENSGVKIHNLTAEQVEAFAAPLMISDLKYWADNFNRYKAPQGVDFLPKVRALAETIEN